MHTCTRAHTWASRWPRWPLLYACRPACLMWPSARVRHRVVRRGSARRQGEGEGGARRPAAPRRTTSRRPAPWSCPARPAGPGPGPRQLRLVSHRHQARLPTKDASTRKYRALPARRRRGSAWLCLQSPFVRRHSVCPDTSVLYLAFSDSSACMRARPSLSGNARTPPPPSQAEQVAAAWSVTACRAA